MICLTGDVHHSSLETADLKYCRGSEINAARTMAQIAENHGINLTLFFTGKCVKEAPDLIRRIARMSNVEVGGHNYWAFKPKKMFNAYYRLTGRKNGPYFYQAYEVRRTIKALEGISNGPIMSWRDHAYRNDMNTRLILASNNIKYLSDNLSADGGQPRWNGGIVDVPINTLPDHDYVYHGDRQLGRIDESPLRNSVFRTGAIPKEAWLNKIMEQVRDIEKRAGLTVILAHPACHECMDNFSIFENLCYFLKSFETIKMREVKVVRESVQ